MVKINTFVFKPPPPTPDVLRQANPDGSIHLTMPSGKIVQIECPKGTQYTNWGLMKIARIISDMFPFVAHVPDEIPEFTECNPVISPQKAIALLPHIAASMLKKESDALILKLYKCGTCCKLFKSARAKRRHEANHNSVGTKICLYCGARIIRADKIKEHLFKHLPPIDQRTMKVYRGAADSMVFGFLGIPKSSPLIRPL